MSYGDNIKIGDFISFKNSSITFSGKGNVLYIEQGVRLEDSNIEFKGDNSLLYLSANKNFYRINAILHNSNVIFFGQDIYFNNRMLLIASESKNIIIGNGCLFSIGVILRNADAHLMYDIVSKKRINHSKSIYIGDHVWVGQNSLILKGTQIGSGCILGAQSVISNKSMPSNTVWAGNPAKQIKKNIFWSEECVHNWNEEKTHEFMTKDIIFSYSFDESVINLTDFENKLTSISLAASRLEYINDYFVGKKSRMFIEL